MSLLVVFVNSPGVEDVLEAFFRRQLPLGKVAVEPLPRLFQRRFCRLVRLSAPGQLQRQSVEIMWKLVPRVLRRKTLHVDGSREETFLRRVFVLLSLRKLFFWSQVFHAAVRHPLALHHADGRHDVAGGRRRR